MEQKANVQENKMGVMPVNRLLISMSLPMMISMLVQALYNVVDSMFVARVSEDALTAVSMAFPVQNLMIAIGSGTGVGINAMLSKCLGEKDFEGADDAAKNGIFLAAVSAAAFLFIGLFAVKPFFDMQTDIASINEYGVTYLTICLVLSVGVFCQMTFERLLQSTGRTVYSMITQGTGAIVNIIMDPILIFGLFGFPELGVAGAAIATVMGQFVASLLAVWFNLKKNEDIHISFRGFRPKKTVIGRIYAVGIPSIIMMSIGSVMTYALNQILLRFSSTATAVFGVYFKLQSFVFMPVFGLNNGLIPILAYNYGARSRERIEKALRLAVGYAVSIMLIGTVVFQMFPMQLLGLFNASEDMASIGVVALRVISVNFVFAGFSIALGSVFQAFGQGVFSMLVSIVRQLVVLIPVAYLLSLSGKVNYVWWAFPIAEIVSVCLSIFFFICTYRKCVKPL